MGRKVNISVQGRTEGGETRWFGPGDEVPAEFADSITNPDVWEDADEVPARSDNKAAWVDYAVAKGADREEAEASTKDDLVEQYGE